MTPKGRTILSIDQGTTSSRAILFDIGGLPLKTAQKEHRQIYPQDGWVEHDAQEIWAATLSVGREALAGTSPGDVAAIGITNQRETTLLWDRETGQPVHNAIVWQDRRTASVCARLRGEGFEPSIAAKTGLLLDPYFSGTKLAWLLDNVPGARARAERGELARWKAALKLLSRGYPAGHKARVYAPEGETEAVLAALNITDEFFRTRTSLTNNSGTLAARAEELEKIVDQALALAK